jgi:hypothetical protein
MTVQELIEKLQKLDPMLEVYVEGYEGGYDDLYKIEHIEVCRDFYTEEWYYGNHEEFNAIRKGPANPFHYDIAKGIVLSK